MARNAFSTLLVFVAALAALQQASAAVSASRGGATAVADETVGANPIRRVVSLLQNMAKKVAAEGEKEEELYKKFMCYCKNSGGDLQKSIAESNAKIPQVQSDIEAAEAEVKSLKQDLKAHAEDRTAAKAAMDAATAQRENEHKSFLATSGEYKSYIDALNGAIPAIQQGMAGGFMQTNSGVLLKQAVASDGSLSSYDSQMVMSFLTGTGATTEGYVPKSGEIVGILQQLKEDFEKSLAEVTSEEEEAVKLYDELMEAKSKQVKALTEAIEKKTVRSGELEVSIVNMKSELTEEEAALVADQEFLANLETSCQTKTSEWEERSKTRAEELVAIHETIKILNDDDALELFKKTLPSPGSSLLQVGGNDQRRLKALGIVRRAGWRHETDFVALALSGKQVDFSKVVKMIDDMVALLATEQQDDDTKKEYCEKQIDTTEDKVKDLSKKIEDLETSVADKEEAISLLTTEIKDLMAGIAVLDKEVATATENRKKEHDEYMELMTENNAAKELLAYAKNRLNKFYNPKLYKAPPKRVLTEEERIYTNMGGELEPTAAPGGIAGTGVEVLAQISRHTAQQATLQRDAPPPPPSTWDAYSKKGQETAGVLSMIDLLIRDLDKEMTEATTEEKNAQKDYEELMNDSAKKRAADMKSVTTKEKTKADAEEAKVAATESKKAEGKELMATKQYEMSLHQECDWLLENFEVRQEARAAEVDSLKAAKAVLQGADFSLVQQQGKGGAARNLRGH